MRLLIADKLLHTLTYYLVAEILTWQITRLKNNELFFNNITQTSTKCYVMCCIKVLFGLNL